jgi:hypothetical protein
MGTARMPPLVSELKEIKIRKSGWFLHRNLVHEVSDSHKTAGYFSRTTGRFLWHIYDRLSGLLGSTCQTQVL